MNNKEDAAVGVVIGFILTIGVVGLLAVPPAMYYYGKYSDWCSNSSVGSTPTSEDRTSINQFNAYVDCSSRAEKHFGTVGVTSCASSTAPNWSSYDCYGTKLQRIP